MDASTCSPQKGPGGVSEYARWGSKALSASARTSTAHGWRARRKVDATVAKAARHDTRTTGSSSLAPRSNVPIAASAWGGSASPRRVTA
eukprot:scaffold230984_cov31-Tisochrysis_lutea.AAC.5